MNKYQLIFLRLSVRFSVLATLIGLTTNAVAMGLTVETSHRYCGQSDLRSKPNTLPQQALKRLPQSQVARGYKDIAWAWLGSPTQRYPHKALGAAVHAGSLHVLVQGAHSTMQEIVYELPLTRVFEDRMVRLLDLDRDGRDEIIVIESDAIKGSSTVVYGLKYAAKPAIDDKANAVQTRTLVELARSSPTGSTFRWLNPVGVADFDGDGKLDIASVLTPHIGGLLTLYRYSPPKLDAFAQAMDVSNHRMGDLEQNLAVIVQQKDLRPTIILPDMQLKALHALRWEAPGQWKELADAKPLSASVQRMDSIDNGACLLLTDGSWWRARLAH